MSLQTSTCTCNSSAASWDMQMSSIAYNMYNNYK